MCGRRRSRPGWCLGNRRRYACGLCRSCWSRRSGLCRSRWCSRSPRCCLCRSCRGGRRGSQCNHRRRRRLHTLRALPSHEDDHKDYRGGRRCRPCRCRQHPPHLHRPSAKPPGPRLPQTALQSGPRIRRGPKTAGLHGKVVSKRVFHLMVERIVTAHRHPPPALPAGGQAPGEAGT